MSFEPLSCSFCLGTGFCHRCDGTGFIRTRRKKKPGECPECDGSGKCALCQGTGLRPEQGGEREPHRKG